jgi:serine protease Do
MSKGFSIWEVRMNFNTKYIAMALSVLLFSSLAAPLSQAQANTLARTIRIGADGSFLGINMEDVTADNMSAYKLKSERGVIVRSVVKGSPAEKAKLQDNDVLLEYAGFPVRSTQQLSRLVKETPVGRSVDLVVSRDGARVNLTAEIGKSDNSTAGMRNWFEEPGAIFIGPNDRPFQFSTPEDFGGRFEAWVDRKPRLGVTLQPVTDQLGEFLGAPGKKGALVSSVDSDGPSAGKLKAGDVITKADDEAINNPDDLVQYIREKDEGTIAFKVIRDKKELTVTVELPGEDSEKGHKL